jgi:hypothetical protein
MYIEVVVKGAIGDVSASAFPELVVERRQVFVTAAAHAFTALRYLTDHDVEVVVLRRRP